MGRKKSEEINKICGERLSEILKQSGKSQANAARELNVSTVHLNNVIKGRKRLTYDLASDVIQKLSNEPININWLLGKSNKKTESERMEAERINEIISKRFDALSCVEQIVQRHGYEVTEEKDDRNNLSIVITAPNGVTRYLKPKEYMSFLKTMDGIIEGQLLLMFKCAQASQNKDGR